MILKGVLYGVLFWTAYHVFVAIGSHINPGALHYRLEILGGY